MPKVILISGGSDGLGKAIAEKLIPGNQVVILAHNQEKLQAAAKEIGCDFVEAELIDFDHLKSAVDQVIHKYQRIDVLVNNAGVWIEGELDENDPQKIKEVIDVNTTGTIFLTKAVLPIMKQQNSGQIINIVSQDGLCAKKSRSVYHASKWAITGFTKCLQEDMEGTNIKVTAVYPGLMKTTLFQKNNVQRDLTDSLEPSEVADAVEFVINLSSSTYIPEISIKNKLITPTNMDNSNSSTNDLNLDPDMMTTQSTSPQAPTPASTPIISSTPTPDVIDITPGALHTPIEPKVLDITPPQSTNESLSHLSDLTPKESVPAVTPMTTITESPTLSEPPVDSPLTTPLTERPVAHIESIPTVSPLAIDVPGEPLPPTEIFVSATPDITDTSVSVSAPPVSEPTPIASASVPTTPTSPLAEDPDLVKLIK